MSLTWKGRWSPENIYAVGDVVYYQDDGYNYVCISYANGLPPIYSDSGFEKFSLVQIKLIDGGKF